MDIDKLKRMVALDKEKDELEARLKSVKAEIAGLDHTLQELFVEAGIQKMSVDGRTLYLHRDLRASAKAGKKTEACQVLKDIGLEDYISEGFNANSLSAWVREEDRNGRELPQALKEVINVAEIFSVRVINS